VPSNHFPPLRPRSDWLLDPGVRDAAYQTIVNT
jgi:hypothetical protein